MEFDILFEYEYEFEYEFHFQIAFEFLKMLDRLTKKVDVYGRGIHH